MNQTNFADAETPKIARSHPVSGSAEHETLEDEHGHPAELARDQPRPVYRRGGRGHVVSGQRHEIRISLRCWRDLRRRWWAFRFSMKLTRTLSSGA